MDEELMNILSEFDQVDDSSFPDFVLNPRLGEFSDPSIMRLYLKEFRSDDPRIKIIKTGRNRESNYTRYLYKLTVWESYVRDLASDYYPGVPEETATELLLYAADNGILDVEVPNKPRFKSSRKGKLIKKLGYDPTEGVEMDYEELDQLVQAAYEAEGEPNEGAEFDLQLRYTEDEEKCLNAAGKAVMMKSRLSRFTNSSVLSGRNDITLISEYLNSSNNSDIRRDQESAFDLMRKDEELELVPDYILRYNEGVRGGHLSMSGYAVIDSKDQEEVELYRMLIQVGMSPSEIDLMTNGGANLNKTQMKIITSEFGDDALSKIEKFHKLSKKEKKKAKRRQAAENARYNSMSTSLSSLMSMNKHNLGKFGSGSPLSTLAHSIYNTKDDDDD